MGKLLKTFLIVVVCLTLPKNGFAMSNAEGMRLLSVYAMMHYGVSLYERGDYYEASNVFNHVLSLDAHQAEALKLLRQMGYAPLPAFAPIPSHPALPVFVEAPQAARVDFSDNDSLRKAIAAKQEAVERLKNQINQLRAQVLSPSTSN